MTGVNERLRVALIVGCLGQGGAEKQLIYIARALLKAGVEVKVYSLTQGEYYEPALDAMSLQPIWIGKFANPILRVFSLANALLHYRPHIIHSTHFFTNLYAAIVARLWGSISIGSLRNDAFLELKANEAWGRWLLRSPSVLIANSHAAKRNAVSLGIRNDKVYILSNVIDLVEFDEQIQTAQFKKGSNKGICASAVARLVYEKRLDLFLEALALAGRETSDLTGIVIGDGPEKTNLEAIAADIGLLPESVLFLGRRNDVPSLLRQADMLILTSDHEGSPNVLLEAMAAGVPVVTTPAGDADVIVQDGVTGYVVAHDNVEELAKRMVCLAKSHELRRRLGVAGRCRVESHYGVDGLASRLLSIYREIAEQLGNRELQRVLELPHART